MGNGGGDIGIGDCLDDHSIWEVWVTEPLSDDTRRVVKWSRTSFFVGSPTSKPNIMDGKDFSLYHRSEDEAWARKSYVRATQYFQDVRLMANGRQIEINIQSKDQPKPKEYILGG